MRSSKNNSRKTDHKNERFQQSTKKNNQGRQHAGDFESVDDFDINKQNKNLMLPVDRSHIDYPQHNNAQQQDEEDSRYMGNRGGYKKQGTHKRDYDHTGRSASSNNRGTGSDHKKRKNRYG